MSNIVESQPVQVVKPLNLTGVAVSAVLGLPIVLALINWASDHAAMFVPWLIGLLVVIASFAAVVIVFVLLYYVQKHQARKVEIEDRRATVEWKRTTTTALLTAAENRANHKISPDGTLEVIYTLPGRVRVQEISPEPEQLAIAAPAHPIVPVHYREVAHMVPTQHVIMGLRVADGSLRTDDLDNQRTILITGKSRSGKTVSQASRAYEVRKFDPEYLVIDPHFHKATSLSKKLLPLKSSLMRGTNFAWEDAMIFDALLRGIDEFDLRRRGLKQNMRPVFVFIDEINRLMDDKARRFVDPRTGEKVSIAALTEEIAMVCGREGAGFNFFGVFAGQELKHVSRIRRAVHSILIHRTKTISDLADIKEALTINEQRRVLELPTGVAILLDDEGETEELQQVMVDMSDADALQSGEMVEASPAFYSLPTTPLPASLDASGASQMAEASGQNGDQAEVAREAAGSVGGADETIPPAVLKMVMRSIGKRIKNGEDPNGIRRELGITGGRALQEFNEAVKFAQEGL